MRDETRDILDIFGDEMRLAKSLHMVALYVQWFGDAVTERALQAYGVSSEQWEACQVAQRRWALAQYLPAREAVALMRSA